MEKNKVTIKDIAQMAEVGVGTVSRVLNNNPNVKDSTRKRVMEIAEELHYVPNGAARMLVAKSRSVMTVGLLVPYLENQFFFEILKALNDRLKMDNYNLMIFNTEDEQQSAINLILEQRMAGMIVLGDHPLSDNERDLLRSHRIPYLFIDYYGEKLNYIRFDNYMGGRLAADYLLSNNCRKVILIGESHESPQQMDRFRGFSDRIGERDSTVTISVITLPLGENTIALTQTLMNDPKLDGIFFFSDEMAYGGIQAKLECKSSVSIIGYDDIFPSKFIGLSTIRQSSKILGAEAGSAILELIKHREEVGPLVQKVLTPELIDRNS